MKKIIVGAVLMMCAGGAWAGEFYPWMTPEEAKGMCEIHAMITKGVVTGRLNGKLYDQASREMDSSMRVYESLSAPQGFSQHNMDMLKRIYSTKMPRELLAMLTEEEKEDISMTVSRVSYRNCMGLPSPQQLRQEQQQ